MWLVLSALELPLGPAPWWALQALSPQLAYPCAGVALAAKGLAHLSFVGLHNLQAADFELCGARHSLHSKAGTGERA